MVLLYHKRFPFFIFCELNGVHFISSNPFFICIYLFPSAIQIMTHKISAVSNALLNPMKMVTSAKAEITAFVNFSFILFLKINPSALPRRTVATFCSDRVRSRLSFFAFAILALLLCCFGISGNIPCVIAMVFTFGQKLYHNLI